MIAGLHFAAHPVHTEAVSRDKIPSIQLLHVNCIFYSLPELHCTVVHVYAMRGQAKKENMFSFVHWDFMNY